MGNIFYRIILSLFVALVLFVTGHYLYRQYERIEREGGELKLLDYVIYSKSRPDDQAITSKKASTDSRLAITDNNDERIYHGQPLNGIKQTFQSTASCPPRRDNAIETNRKKQVYQWKDENGNVTMADRPPKKIVGTLPINDLNILDYKLADKFFHLDINYKWVAASVDLDNILKRSLKSTYQIITGLLGRDRLRLSHVNLHVYGNRQQYHAVVREYYGSDYLNNAGAPAGFYSSRNNMAVALMTSDNQQQGIKTAIHESVHVLMSELFVTPPTWFNEGIAEYFEMITVLNSVATIHSKSASLDQLRYGPFASKSSPLTYVVNLDGNSFYNLHKYTNYAASWSLVAFLMQHKEGSDFMGHYMNYMSDNYCRTKPTLQLMNQYYPGGTKVLERRWRNWLMHGQQKIQTWRW